MKYLFVLMLMSMSANAAMLQRAGLQKSFIGKVTAYNTEAVAFNSLRVIKVVSPIGTTPNAGDHGCSGGQSYTWSQGWCTPPGGGANYECWGWSGPNGACAAGTPAI